MAVVRKVQSRLVLPVGAGAVGGKLGNKNQDQSPERLQDGNREDANKLGMVKKKKYCSFCRNKLEAHYWDSQSLRRYINDRGRIVPRARTGNCAKHQRQVTHEIKYARHLALLPFIIRV